MTLYDLFDEVTEFNQPPEWIDKMVHRVPSAPVFNRAEYLVKAARNKVVLDVGASGPMSEQLAKVARVYHATDITPNDIKNFHQIDLDKANELRQQAADKQPLTSANPKPAEIDLTGRKRTPDRHQPPAPSRL